MVDVLRTGRPPAAPGSVRDTLRAHIGHDPYERLDDLRRAGERKAEAEGVAYQLEHQRKIVLSRVMGDIEKGQGKIAEGRLERLARASEAYEAHIEGTAEAVRQKEAAQAEYWAIRAGCEMDVAATHLANALARLER